MMKRTASVGWAIGWLGVTSVLAQVQVEIKAPERQLGEVFQRPIVRSPVIPDPRGEVEAKNPERERAIRVHFAQLVGEQFELDESQVAKLKTVWDSEPVSFRTVPSRDSMNRTPVGVVDDLVLSRDGIAALMKVLDPRQFAAFFKSMIHYSRNVQADLAGSNRMVLAVDSILCLLPEQREEVGAQLWASRRAEHSDFELLLLEPASLFNAAYLERGPILESLLSERQKEVWNLVKSYHSQIRSLQDKIRSEARLKERQERVINRGVGRPIENERRPEPPQPARNRLAEINQARIEVTNRQLDTTQSGLEEVALRALEVHIGSLGELDEAVSRRLKLAARGAVLRIREELKAETSEKSESQSFTREEKALAAVRERMLVSISGESRGYLWPFWHRILTGLQNYPLYRMTIEEILSPEAFADYQAIQAEREKFRRKSARRAALAALDLRLLLNREQRRYVETQLERSDADLSVLGMVFEVAKSLDGELFDDWQRNELASFFAEQKEE